MSDQYRAPATALDVQVDMLGELMTTPMQARIRDAIAASTPDSMTAPPVTDEQVLRMLLIGEEALGGWTCWVSAEAVQVIAAAAETIPPPDGAISAGVIPHQSGVMWISGDPLMLNAGSVRGIGWSCQILESPDGSGGWSPNVAVTLLLEEPGESADRGHATGLGRGACDDAAGDPPGWRGW